ncbi:hypothetical protein VOLCADRAFT_91656 [Volvox carteri f. nagariensis]|uniref:Protein DETOXIFICATION n=1 Tax=Volvox carteri f. nagariensis TaxID=3068 RepID=D8TXN2_VOLCA|nr:uncharacterized protein VOLCADRAFT_91656 [Volvox carteri f. nagariensis]EFJ47754.1 hypothetical protein VOLCADRAFT_91656 [Volvox carteri f. nagariensis]|eukprot:XP_002951225.1 hypothetical protein VOLCADRAFT_91656 [Volvox carteri f. nagariensis]
MRTDCCFQLWDNRFRLATNRSPRVATAAAAAAASAFAQEEDDSPLAALKRRVQQLSTSPYDKEIWAVALPALVAMLLEPVMNALNAGMRACIFVSMCVSFSVSCSPPPTPTRMYRLNVSYIQIQVSCIVAKSLWIAVVSGVASAAAMFAGAEAIVAMLKPPEAAVAAFAIDYIRVRSLAIPAVLLGFVATAVFRGFKDTRTPLFGALVSAAVSLGLNVLFLYVLRLGVVGSAVATAAAQIVSCCLLLGALFAKGRGGGGGGGVVVQARHLRRPPPLSVMVPTLKLGAVLGARNIISFGMVIYASALSIRMGSTYQASFEVIRQIWLLAIQFFECLNVATQALCATYLGQEVLGALPMICIFFPLDAAAAIMDGSLLAAKQSNFMSAVQIAGSVVQYVVLSYLAATGNVTSLTVWSALKILNVLRVVGGVSRNYYSARSGYTPVVTAAPQLLPAVAAVAATAAVEPRVEQITTIAPPGSTATAAAAAPPPLLVQVGAGARLAVAATSPPSPEAAAALQSYEDDVMVLACAACTSATEMNPDMLGLKRRNVTAAAAAAATSDGGTAGADGDASALLNGVDGDDEGSGSRSGGGGGGRWEEAGAAAVPLPPPPPSAPVTVVASSAAG